MRIFLCLLVGAVLFVLGCTERPELSPGEYGIVLEALPDIDTPFVLPVDAGGNDHKNCKFSDVEF